MIIKNSPRNIIIRLTLVLCVSALSLFFLGGCGGGGSDGGEVLQPQQDVGFLYQDVQLENREGHQIIGMIVDRETGYFVAPEYRTAGVMQPRISGGIFGVGDDAAMVLLGNAGLPEEVVFNSGERLVLSEYGTQSVRSTLYAPGGSVVLNEVIQIDPNQLNALRLLLMDLGFGGEPQILSSDQWMSVASAAISKDSSLRVLALGMNVISCGFSTYATLQTGGAAIAFMAVSCGNLAIKALAAAGAYPENIAAFVPTGLDVVGCGSSLFGNAEGVFDCAGLLADHMVNSKYTFSRMTLHVDGAGQGQIGSSYRALNCSSLDSPCGWTFADSLVIDLTALPAIGSRFAMWRGDCLGFAPTCELATSTDRTVRAAFDVVPITPHYFVNIGKTGTGAGTVRSTPAGIDCGVNCSVSFAEGTVVELIATPTAGSEFVGWDGDCSGFGVCIIELREDKAISAKFDVAEPPDVDPPRFSGGWATLTVGDPGVPGDGILIESTRWCGTNQCWFLEEPFFMSPSADGFTISIYGEIRADVSPSLRFVDPSVSPLKLTLPGPSVAAPTVNGVAGEMWVFTRSQLEQWASESGLSEATADNAFLWQINASWSPNLIDGVYLGLGVDDVPK